MGKSPEEMLATMIANLKETTGKTIEQWLAVVKKTGLQKHGEIVKHLKAEFGIGHGYANTIAHRSLAAGKPAVEGDDLIATQYTGAKAALRPIYDALVKAVEGFGKDVELAPKKAYVSVRRSKQFALFQPSTATRLDVGLNLKGKPASGRLEASGSFNAMVSHRVRLGAASEVNRELIGWLREAYEQA